MLHVFRSCTCHCIKQVDMERCGVSMCKFQGSAKHAAKDKVTSYPTCLSRSDMHLKVVVLLQLLFYTVVDSTVTVKPA